MKIAIPTILTGGLATSVLLLACTLGPKSDTGESQSTGGSSGAESGSTPTTEDSPPNPTAGPTTSPTTAGPTDPTTGAPPDPSEGSTAASDTSGFIVAPDVAEVPGACDLAAQRCPEGQKCNPSGIGDTSIFQGQPICVPLVEDPKPPGAPCSVLGDPLDGTDDCELGSVCLFPDDRGVGECHALCNIESGDPPDPTCPPGDQCVGTACQTCFWSFCDQPCDPRDLGTCKPGEACIPTADSWFCTTDASGDDGQAGDSCEFVNACDPGLFCAAAMTVPDCDPKANGCCAPFCSTDKPNTCPGKDQGVICSPWYEQGQAPPELVTLGACVLPK